MGVTGANYHQRYQGITVTENEGNARLSCAFPKTHIAVVGIEKMIPSITDLGMFWPLLATFGTGQKITVYNTIVTGRAGKRKWMIPERDVRDPARQWPHQYSAKSKTAGKPCTASVAAPTQCMPGL